MSGIIDEIEAAARHFEQFECGDVSQLDGPGAYQARDLIRFIWWPRIRAAIEAGQEMEELLKFSGTPTFPAQAKFRAAVETTDRARES